MYKKQGHTQNSYFLERFVRNQNKNYNERKKETIKIKEYVFL